MILNKSQFRSFFAAIFGLIICAFLIRIVGESPLAVLQIFFQGATGSPYDLGYSLFYAVPLALAALAVSVGLRAKLFNIGVEGQLTIAALAAALTGLYGPFEPVLNRSLGFLAAILAGFLWGALLGYLRAHRQVHEVVAGIMLNFIAFGLTSSLALNFFKDPNNQNPETAVLADSIRVSAWQYFQQAPISWIILIAPLTALLLWGGYRWTALGFSMEASGANPVAARQAGISNAAMQFWALSFSGLIAGVIGFIEVYGNSGRFVVGFSPGYGFTGIAVALLGQLQPFKILLVALIFGGMYKGSLDLDFETKWITRDFVMILQATLILFMSSNSLLPAGLLSIWQKLRRSWFGHNI